MGLRIRREGVDEFEIPNGQFIETDSASFNALTKLLRGHPCGIHELILQPNSATIVVARAMELLVSNRPRRIDNPVHIRQLTGEIGDLDITFGQTYATTHFGIIQAIIYRGASIELESQGERMIMAHTLGAFVDH